MEQTEGKLRLILYVGQSVACLEDAIGSTLLLKPMNPGPTINERIGALEQTIVADSCTVLRRLWRTRCCKECQDDSGLSASRGTGQED